MEVRGTEVRFDGPEVHEAGARLLGSADDADRDVRSALGSVESGRAGTGSRYVAAGVAIDEGYRRLRLACESWIGSVQQHADAVRATAARYEENERDAVDVLSRMDPSR